MDIGSLMGGLPTSDTQPASLEDQWSQALKRPEIQAGLLNFGIELMKPRWSGASALPDALSAGARGYAGVQEEDYKRQQQQAEISRGQAEKQADRDTRLDSARIMADSRAEVQGLRNEAMLQGIQMRGQIKNQLTNLGMTPAELKIYDAEKKRYYDLLKNDLTTLAEAKDPAKIEAEADAVARARVTALRAQGLDGGAGGITSGNSQNAPAPMGGTPGAAGQKTSANTSTSPKLPSAQQAIENLKRAGRWPLRAEELQYLRTKVSDPEYLENYMLSQRPR